MKKICLISTLNHNVGDDFVREGIVRLLRQALGEIECMAVHKHFPVSVRGMAWQKLDRWVRLGVPRPDWRVRISEILDCLPMKPLSDRVMQSDLVVQCGAPVYWKNSFSKCSDAEWFQPLIEKRWLKRRSQVPLLNLGAGACLAPGSNGTEVADDPSCREFINKLTSWTSITTVRDSLAQDILRRCGHEVTRLFCPSIFAPQESGIVHQPGEYVALNYMPAGGHYDLAGNGRTLGSHWEGVFGEIVSRLTRKKRCLMICHDQKEMTEAARLFPEIPRFYSRSWRDYLGVYSRCRFAVVNRVHGAMVAAALGKNVLLVGNDTRLLTAEGMPGLRTLWVTEPKDLILDTVAQVEACDEDHDTGGFLEKAGQAYQTLLNTLPG